MPLAKLHDEDFKKELAVHVTTLASQFGTVEQVVFDHNPKGSRVIFRRPRSAAEAAAACELNEGGGFKSLGWRNIELRFIGAQAYVITGAPREMAEKQQSAAAPVEPAANPVKEIDGLQAVGTGQGLLFKPSQPKVAPPIDPNANLSSKVEPTRSSMKRPPIVASTQTQRPARPQAQALPPRLFDAEPRPRTNESWRDGTPVPIAIPSDRDRLQNDTPERYQHPAEIMLSGEHWSVRPNALLRYVDGEVDQPPTKENLAAEEEERQLLGAFDRYAHNLSILEAAENRANGLVIEMDGEGLEALTNTSPPGSPADVAVKLESWLPETAVRTPSSDTEMKAQALLSDTQRLPSEEAKAIVAPQAAEAAPKHRNDVSPAKAVVIGDSSDLSSVNSSTEPTSRLQIKTEPDLSRSPAHERHSSDISPSAALEAAAENPSIQVSALTSSVTSVTPQARARTIMSTPPRSPSIPPLRSSESDWENDAKHPSPDRRDVSPRTPSASPPSGPPPTVPASPVSSEQEADMEMDIDSPSPPPEQMGAVEMHPEEEEEEPEEEETIELPVPVERSPTVTPTLAHTRPSAPSQADSIPRKRRYFEIEEKSIEHPASVERSPTITPTVARTRHTVSPPADSPRKRR